MMGELARVLKESGPRRRARRRSRPNSWPDCSRSSTQGTISGSIAKDVFEKMFTSGQSADEIVAAEGLAQIDDESQIVALIADVLTANADAVAQYRGGKTATLGFLVGQVMKATAGKANPKRVNELLKRELAAASRRPAAASPSYTPAPTPARFAVYACAPAA